ncbi:hypothetical protein [Agromyces salentinus]|uniref:SnoaL-like domain-containing protein n=1 Tax=Agromyces salentinus TaxID=269421 RepID=A0ABN2MKM5_9MICO|nr:hypothetical protein [Agromyces salentinus]
MTTRRIRTRTPLAGEEAADVARDARIDEAEVAWIVTKRGAAMRSRDGDWLAARYLPGAEVVGVSPPVTRVADPGTDAVRLWEWFELLQGRIRWTVRVERLDLAHDGAVCRVVERVSYRELARPRVRTTLETSIGLRRVEGRWRIEWELGVVAGA